LKYFGYKSQPEYFGREEDKYDLRVVKVEIVVPDSGFPLVTKKGPEPCRRWGHMPLREKEHL
jgi:hypothetical protein